MEEETSLKKMRLSIRQEDISTVAIADNEERKQLWEEWKKIHPESQKSWKREKARDSDSLRCQAAVVIKKVSANVEKEIYHQDFLNSSGEWSDQGSIQSDESQDIENSAIFNRGSVTREIVLDPDVTNWPKNMIDQTVILF